MGRSAAERAGLRIRGGSLQFVEIGGGPQPQVRNGILASAGNNGTSPGGEQEFGGWIRGVIQDRGLHTRRVSAVVDDDSLYVRLLELPAASLGRGAGALAYAVGPFLPYPVADAVLQARPVQSLRGGGTRRV